MLESKTVLLAANVPATVRYGGAEFTRGYGEAVVQQPISLALSIANGTSSVVYLGLSYTTRTQTYRLLERQSLSGVNAGITQLISARSVPALAMLEAGVTEVAIELISASGGSVTVQLMLEEQPGATQTLPPLGLDVQVQQEFQPFRASASPLLPAGADITATLYQVPAGKRALLTTLFVEVPPTPVAWGALAAIVLLDGALVARAMSRQEGPVVVFRVGELLLLPAGAAVAYRATNTTSATRYAMVHIAGREFF